MRGAVGPEHLVEYGLVKAVAVEVQEVDLGLTT